MMKRRIIDLVGSDPVLIDKKIKCEAAFPFFRDVKKRACPTRWGCLDAFRNLWEQRDPKLLQMVELFTELLERDRHAALQPAVSCQLPPGAVDR